MSEKDKVTKKINKILNVPEDSVKPLNDYSNPENQAKKDRSAEIENLTREYYSNVSLATEFISLLTFEERKALAELYVAGQSLDAGELFGKSYWDYCNNLAKSELE